MSDASGDGRTGPTGPGRDEQFTVPVPIATTQALPMATPVAAGARWWPTSAPATDASPPPAPQIQQVQSAQQVQQVQPNPYAGQPVWPTTAGDSTEEVVDPLLAQIGVALFWMTVGWWVFVLTRVLGYLARHVASDTVLIRVIDRGSEETILAAVLSVFAALLLLLGRGRGGRSPLGWAAAALAVITVGTAVWRVLP